MNYESLMQTTMFLKSDIFAYEYPGYGAADPMSTPSEQGCYDAVNSAWAHVTQVLKVHPSNIILFGRSLGTGPTIDLASRQPEVGGMILQSPLTSAIRSQCCECLAVWLCCLDVFNSVEKIKAVHCQTLIMHGTHDEVVPCHNGRKLYQELEKQYDPLWVQGAGHNDMEYHAGALMRQHLQGFINTLKKKKASQKNNQCIGKYDGYQGKPLPVM